MTYRNELIGNIQDPNLSTGIYTIGSESKGTPDGYDNSGTLIAMRRSAYSTTAPEMLSLEYIDSFGKRATCTFLNGDWSAWSNANNNLSYRQVITVTTVPPNTEQIVDIDYGNIDKSAMAFSVLVGVAGRDYSARINVLAVYHSDGKTVSRVKLISTFGQEIHISIAVLSLN